MKKFFFLLMSLTLCFASCSKEDDDPIMNDPELNGGIASGNGTSIPNDDIDTRYADYKGTVSSDDFGGLVIGSTLVKANNYHYCIYRVKIDDYHCKTVEKGSYFSHSEDYSYIVMPNITKIAKGCFKDCGARIVFLKYGAKIEFESDALEGISHIYYYDEYIPKSSN